MRNSYPPENKGPSPACAVCGVVFEPGEEAVELDPDDRKSMAFDRTMGRKRYVHEACAKKFNEEKSA